MKFRYSPRTLALSFAVLCLISLTSCIAVTSNTIVSPSTNVQSVSLEPRASGGAQSEQHAQTAVTVEEYHWGSESHFPTFWQLLILKVSILLLLVWLVGRWRRRRREAVAFARAEGKVAGSARPGA